MRHYRHLILAFAVGVVLAIICIYVSGVMAAFPTPPPLSVLAKGHYSFALMVLDLLGALPVALLSWLTGRVLFRAVGTKSALLWLMAACPWVVYGIDGVSRYIQVCGAQIWASPALLLGWVVSLFSVPAGLWLALRSARKGTALVP